MSEVLVSLMALVIRYNVLEIYKKNKSDFPTNINFLKISFSKLFAKK